MENQTPAQASYEAYSDLVAAKEALDVANTVKWASNFLHTHQDCTNPESEDSDDISRIIYELQDLEREAVRQARERLKTAFKYYQLEHDPAEPAEIADTSMYEIPEPVVNQ